jgi:hypothetical protein
MIANSPLLRQTNLRACLKSCPNWTKAKRRFATSKRLRTPSRSTARTLLNPRISSRSSARPKSVSIPSYDVSDSASSRSSSLERFGSFFFDRFTFFSVSVTEYPRLPSGLRPAPLRFPPRFEIILSFLIDIELISRFPRTEESLAMHGRAQEQAEQTGFALRLFACETGADQAAFEAQPLS